MAVCQHCNATADDARTYCPSCRKRLRPAAQRPATAHEDASTQTAIVPPPLPGEFAPGLHPYGCEVCGATPARSGKFSVVRSYVVFFRWASPSGTWCRACAQALYSRSQYTCLTRGWWGLLFGPIANTIAIAGNASSWRRFKSLAAPMGAQHPALTERPVRRRPFAYVATAVVVALFAAVFAATPSDEIEPQAAAAPAPTVGGPTHDRIAPLTGLFPAPRKGWKVSGDDLALTVATLRKRFSQPEEVEAELSRDGFIRGLSREYFQAEPREVTEVEVWQFASPAGAQAFLDVWVASNSRPGAASLRDHFAAGKDGHGFMGNRLDDYGFHYAVAARRVGDIFVRVRHAALSPVTRTAVAGVLDWACGTAARPAQPAA